MTSGILFGRARPVHVQGVSQGQAPGRDWHVGLKSVVTVQNWVLSGNCSGLLFCSLSLAVCHAHRVVVCCLASRCWCSKQAAFVFGNFVACWFHEVHPVFFYFTGLSARTAALAPLPWSKA